MKIQKVMNFILASETGRSVNLVNEVRLAPGFRMA